MKPQALAVMTAYMLFVFGHLAYIGCQQEGEEGCMRHFWGDGCKFYCTQPDGNCISLEEWNSIVDEAQRCEATDTCILLGHWEDTGMCAYGCSILVNYKNIDLVLDARPQVGCTYDGQGYFSSEPCTWGQYDNVRCEDGKCTADFCCIVDFCPGDQCTDPGEFYRP